MIKLVFGTLMVDSKTPLNWTSLRLQKLCHFSGRSGIKRYWFECWKV